MRNRQSEIEGQFHSAPKEKHISDLHERINQTTINLTNQIGDVSRELGEVIGKLDSSNDLLKSIHTAIINGNRK
ncbi:hypothetical protein [Methylogaea oryzae]|uniref:hypothetical protein n=1 Tax=Methylogaea oryzae TaxID=1295382 RepID=UPI0006CFDF06|nr:hypothetical protein [Methylogaea oryzae]